VKKTFIQPIPPYGAELLVVSGYDNKGLRAVLTRHKYPKEIIDNIPADGRKIFATLYHSDIPERKYVLHLSGYGRGELYDTLTHETNHLIYLISRWFGFEDEMEAQAYLQEWLHKEIRKKL
jgi:hypothetical protein